MASQPILHRFQSVEESGQEVERRGGICRGQVELAKVGESLHETLNRDTDFHQKFGPEELYKVAMVSIFRAVVRNSW